jgi:methylthioribose-1-phosphate isomerase
MSAFHTLRWVDDSLELLDQRLLPVRCEYPRYGSAEAVAGAIRDLVVRGAPAIGCAAAYGIAVEALRLRGQSAAQFDAGLQQAFDVLGASRPTAINLRWALERMRTSLADSTGMDNNARADALLTAARNIADEDVRINRAMGTHGAALLPDVCCVMTHCNAGALATAGHGTALGIIRSAVNAGKKIEVIANETRPFLQGARLTAWEMQQDGIPVTLIADSAAGYMMGQRVVDAVIVGADRVAANGDVANKIGTYMMAVLAQRHGIPFYVACPLSTIDPAMPDGSGIPIEERDGGEIAGYGSLRWAPAGIHIANPVFDVTPAELVTALITERGVLNSPSPSGIVELLGSR